MEYIHADMSAKYPLIVTKRRVMKSASVPRARPQPGTLPGRVAEGGGLPLSVCLCRISFSPVYSILLCSVYTARVFPASAMPLDFGAMITALQKCVSAVERGYIEVKYREKRELVGWLGSLSPYSSLHPPRPTKSPLECMRRVTPACHPKEKNKTSACLPGGMVGGRLGGRGGEN